MAQDGSNMAPVGVKMAAGWPRDGPKSPQDGPNMAQDGPEMARETPRWPRTAPRWPQDAPRWPTRRRTESEASAEVLEDLAAAEAAAVEAEGAALEDEIFDRIWYIWGAVGMKACVVVAKLSLQRRAHVAELACLIPFLSLPLLSCRFEALR